VEKVYALGCSRGGEGVKKVKAAPDVAASTLVPQDNEWETW